MQEMGTRQQTKQNSHLDNRHGYYPVVSVALITFYQRNFNQIGDICFPNRIALYCLYIVSTSSCTLVNIWENYNVITFILACIR